MKVLPHSHEDCKTKIIGGDRNTRLCIQGSYVDGKGVCYGDSGGPLFISQDGHQKLIGIASRIEEKENKESVLLSPGFAYFQGLRINCAQTVNSGYTKVNQYVEWIENQIGGRKLVQDQRQKGLNHLFSYICLLIWNLFLTMSIMQIFRAAHKC